MTDIYLCGHGIFRVGHSQSLWISPPKNVKIRFYVRDRGYFDSSWEPHILLNQATPPSEMEQARKDYHIEEKWASSDSGYCRDYLLGYPYGIKFSFLQNSGIPISSNAGLQNIKNGGKFYVSQPGLWIRLSEILKTLPSAGEYTIFWLACREHVEQQDKRWNLDDRGNQIELSAEQSDRNAPRFGYTKTQPRVGRLDPRLLGPFQKR